MEKKVVVGVVCPYTSTILKDAFEQSSQWSVVEAPEEDSELWDGIDLQWDEYETINWSRVLKGKLIANAYCIRKGLIRKGQLANNINKYRSKYPESILAHCFPETQPFELEHPEYVEETLCELPEIKYMPEGQVWILKPNVLNQAHGLRIFKSVEEFSEIIQECPEDIREWVVQRYITNPLLINNKKFHIRAYVVCVGDLEVYLWSDMLALFSAEDYDLDDLGNVRAHITNTCAQHALAKQDDFETNEEILVQKVIELDQQGHLNAHEITDKISGILNDTFAAVHTEMDFMPLPNAFELFGFDFIVSDDKNVWLLEANAEPDMAMTGDRLRPLIIDFLQSAKHLVTTKLFHQEEPPILQSENPGSFLLCYNRSSFASQTGPIVSFQ